VLCAGITVYKGLKESGARPGQTVAIVGAGGGLGSLACQYARAMGLEVIAIDGGDEKKAMTAKLGASKYVDFMTSKNVVSDVKAATADGLGPHAVILVAVNEKPFQQAAECMSPCSNQIMELNANVMTRRSTKRYGHCYRSPRWSLSPRTGLRVCHQDDYHQGFLRRQ
jgi:D-arabinose 1-dehydrogenase-like Zn-dependent alcohol dehydrogenase